MKRRNNHTIDPVLVVYTHGSFEIYRRFDNSFFLFRTFDAIAAQGGSILACYRVGDHLSPTSVGALNAYLRTFGNTRKWTRHAGIPLRDSRWGWLAFCAHLDLKWNLTDPDEEKRRLREQTAHIAKRLEEAGK